MTEGVYFSTSANVQCFSDDFNLLSRAQNFLNKYIGESELAVRTIFSRARTCSPCILFFDEVILALDFFFLLFPLLSLIMV